MKKRTFKLNKLVRDKIVSDHIENGGQVKARRLSGKKKQEALLTKMVEEAKEALKSDQLLPELADMQEIIDQLAHDANLSKEKIKSEQTRKRTVNGGFKNGDYIETETWPAGHKWAKYYAAEPERFSEVENG